MQSVLKYEVLKIICACFSKNGFCGEKYRKKNLENNQTLSMQNEIVITDQACVLFNQNFYAEKKKRNYIF